MSNARAGRDTTHPVNGRAFDADPSFLTRWAAPLGLVARAMLSYIFIVDGFGAIAHYGDVAGYMTANGVDARLLPLVIVAEVGFGLMLLFGFRTRWAAIALCGFCLLTVLLFHMGPDQTIMFQKNIAMAGGLLALAILGPGAWSFDAWRGPAL
jgi:putative oxidoreductase